MSVHVVQVECCIATVLFEAMGEGDEQEKVSDAALTDGCACATTTYGFRKIRHDDDGLVVVVDLDYGSVELLQRFVEAVNALGDSLQKQRLPLLLQWRIHISHLVSSASRCSPPFWRVELTCGFSMMRSGDYDGGDMVVVIIVSVAIQIVLAGYVTFPAAEVLLSAQQRQPRRARVSVRSLSCCSVVLSYSCDNPRDDLS